MSWISKLFASSGSADRGPGADFWYEPLPGFTQPIRPVTEAAALTVPAVYDCLQVISRPIATLPLQVFRRLPGGAKEPVGPDHELARLLTRPNARDTSWEFRGQMAWDLGLHNNAYAEIEEGPRRMARLDPKKVRIEQSPIGGVRYRVTRPGGRQDDLAEDQVWHLKGLPLSDDGLTGRPQLETAAPVIAAALAMQDYTSRFFINDTSTGGIVSIDTGFKDQESRKNFLKAWREQGSGVNRHADRVIEHGGKYFRRGATPEEAQFLETRKQSALEISQIWQVPPHKIGIFDGATHSNVEQQALSFLTETMLPLFELFEQAIVRDHVDPDEKDTIFAEFNVAGLLRADLEAQSKAFSLGRQWGWLSVNEVRAFLNMNPIEEGNGYMEPLNMAPLGEERPPAAPPSSAAFAASGAEQVLAFLECLKDQEVRAALAEMNGTHSNGSLNGHA